MSELTIRNKEHFIKLYQGAHQDGALDAKTKMLMHIALTLAMRCEPWVESNLAVARKMGITEEELAETIQLASSVGAGTITAMAKRASKKTEPENESESLSNLVWRTCYGIRTGTGTIVASGLTNPWDSSLMA